MSNARKLADNLPTEGSLSGRNMVINGAMNIAQRSSSETGLGASSGYFMCDRWRMGVSSSGRLTMSQSSDAPDGFNNSLKLQCTTADTSIDAGEYMLLQQLFEGQDLQRIGKGTSSAKKITVSFYVKGNGNATYMCELWDNDNNRHATQQFSVTSSWTRVVLTFNSDTTGALDDDSNLSLYLNFWLHAGSTFGGGSYTANTWASNVNANRAVGASSFFSSTSNTFQITGVQMEVGSQASPFEHEPVGVTLSKCQRYLQMLIRHTENDDQQIGSYFSSSRAFICVPHKVSMRATPTISVVGSVAGTMYSNNGAITTTTLSSTYARKDSSGLDFTPSSSAGAGNAFHFDWTQTSSAHYIKAEAEL